MGVKGLCTFIDKNSHFSEQYKLHNTRVVIDGSNIAHYLYINSGADCTLGGDYGEYADKVKDYFSTFMKCNIEAIVIFDGGLEVTDRKFDTLLRKREDRLMKVKSLIENYEIPDGFQPINAAKVLKEVLSEIGIPFARCDYEGDNQMASLANDYKCPVLSDDSDFYIFNLRYGFIRLSHINTNINTKMNKNGSLVPYLNCRIYHVETLFEYYPLEDKSILYLIAVLAGNDYVKYDDFKRFYCNAKIYKKEKFTTLFSLLRFHNLKQAINDVLELTERHRKSHIKNLIENSIEDYILKPNNLNDVLELRKLNTNQELVASSNIATICGEIIPAQFVVAYHKGLISSHFLDIITFQRRLLAPQMEKFCYESSHVCSRYIRQVTYGILLQHNTKYSVPHRMKCLQIIKEYDRVKDDFRKVNVKFLIQLKNGQLVPRLADVFNMEKRQRSKFITDVLELEECIFADIPNNLQLLFGCIMYWLCNCWPRPTKQFLDSLLLCIIYYQVRERVSREKTFSERRTSTDPIIKICKDNPKSKSSIIENISSSNAQLIFTNIGIYLQKAILNPDNPLDLDIVHSYSLFQSCVFDIIALNSLLVFPFDSIHLHKCVSGTLLHNLTVALTLSLNTEVLIEHLLGNNVENIDIFNRMKCKVIENISDNYFGKGENLEETLTKLSI